MSFRPPPSEAARMPLQAFFMDSVDSTNEAAKRFVRDGTITQSAYVVATEQTAGKGNRGRCWCSPKDAGVYVSVVDVSSDEVAPPSTLCTLAAGVACAEVLRERTGVDVCLKPINDLYVGTCKLGGILTESLVENGCARTIITGVGINTLAAPRDVEAASAEPVSLEELVGAERVSKMLADGLVLALVRRIFHWNEMCRANDRVAVKNAWESLCLPDAEFPSEGSG